MANRLVRLGKRRVIDTAISERSGESIPKSFTPEDLVLRFSRSAADVANNPEVLDMLTDCFGEASLVSDSDSRSMYDIADDSEAMVFSSEIILGQENIIDKVSLARIARQIIALVETGNNGVYFIDHRENPKGIIVASA